MTLLELLTSVLGSAEKAQEVLDALRTAGYEVRRSAEIERLFGTWQSDH